MLCGDESMVRAGGKVWMGAEEHKGEREREKKREEEEEEEEEEGKVRCEQFLASLDNIASVLDAHLPCDAALSRCES